MRSLKKLAMLAIGLGISINAFADNWQTAYRVNDERADDISYSHHCCTYKTNRGYAFTIIYDGLCPFSIEVDPVSGRWRE